MCNRLQTYIYIYTHVILLSAAPRCTCCGAVIQKEGLASADHDVSNAFHTLKLTKIYYRGLNN